MNEKDNDELKQQLDIITELSKMTKRLYLLYLGAVAYCVLILVGTSDRQIALNEPVTLPVLSFEVPLFAFLYLGPVLLIALFVYFQYYYQHLEDTKGRLIKKHKWFNRLILYPWILNFATVGTGSEGVLENLPSNGERSFFDRVVCWIRGMTLYILVWYSLPLVLIRFQWVCLKTHDLQRWTRAAVIVGVGLLLTLLFNRYQVRRVNRFISEDCTQPGILRRFAVGSVRSIPIVLFSVLLFGQYLMLRTIKSPSYSRENPPPVIEWFALDLSNQKLIQEPKVDYQGVYWADLKGVQWEYADLTSAVLKRADLRDACLNHIDAPEAMLDSANLWSAHLDSANLYEAHLEGANLRSAHLEGANLRSAHLEGAGLLFAHLEGANLNEAHLEGANLFQAHLDSANLNKAYLKGANLSHTQGLTRAQLAEAITDSTTILPDYFKEESEDSTAARNGE